jgi:hypothetical protein
VLTDREVRLLAHAYTLRLDEQDETLWFCPGDQQHPEAIRLAGRGYLQRAWHDGDLVFRFSDQALAAQGLSELIENAKANAN